MSSAALERLSEHRTARAFDEAASLGRPWRGSLVERFHQAMVSPIYDENGAGREGNAI
jgi:hypothetical protein